MTGWHITNQYVGPGIPFSENFTVAKPFRKVLSSKRLALKKPLKLCWPAFIFTGTFSRSQKEISCRKDDGLNENELAFPAFLIPLVSIDIILFYHCLFFC